MAQFGKHLYGSSFFGKSNSFVGNYDSRIIDIGEELSGEIRIELDSYLPSLFYESDDFLFNYDGEHQLEENYTNLERNSKVSIYLSGKNLEIHSLGGSAQIAVQEQHTEETRYYEINNIDIFSLENFPTNHLENYTITIEATSDFKFKGIKAKTTEIQGVFRAAPEDSMYTESFFNQDWTLSSGEVVSSEADSIWSYYFTLDFDEVNENLVIETERLNDIRFIQLRLMLLTTDSQSSPEVHSINFSDGDLTRYRPSGNWHVSLDMENIAEEEGVTFERVKEVTWIEKEFSGAKIDIHSSSRNGSTPSISNIINDNYWSDLTAKYTLKHTGVEEGVPYNRISLKERNNGYAQSARLGSLFVGPINTKEMSFTNTTLNAWRKITGGAHYPRNSNQSSSTIEFFENKNDVDRGVPPFYVSNNIEANKEELLNISTEYSSFYIRISLTRDSGVSTPVMDDLQFYAQLKYNSLRQLTQYTDELSALDGYEKDSLLDKGEKIVREIPNTVFDWPNVKQDLMYNAKSIQNSEKTVRIEYTPKYIDQVYLGLNSIDVTEYVFTSTYPEKYEVHSKVYAKEPTLSERNIDSNKIYYHYSYNGGSINFPSVVEHQLTTQFTPLLARSKKYKFYLENGWSDEIFKVPQPMTFEEIAEITLSDIEELITLNKNVPLYDEMILAGYEIILPNTTENELVNLIFKKSNDVVTEFSILNNEENDVIQASIERGNNFSYEDWRSNEVIFNAIVNYGDSNTPYVRVQNSAYDIEQFGNHVVSKEVESALEIATRFNVDVEDLVIVNNRKNEFEETGNVLFKRNTEVLIPGKYTLPDVVPKLIYNGEHPYVVEVIPGSVRRVKGNIRLADNLVTPGNLEEEAITYTLTESNTQTERITRGSVRNGSDPLPYSNVIRIQDIRNVNTGERYIPVTDYIGDYKLRNNYIDWSASFNASKEPAEGEQYDVTFTRGVVDRLKIIYSSDYTEKMSQNRMESIPVYNEKKQVDLKEDVVIELPTLEEMKERYPDLNNLRYKAQHDDIWINSTVDKNKLKLSLNKDNPDINWYPTINTGFYYLNSQEYYLYSDLIETVYDYKDIPVIKDVKYTDKGIYGEQKETWGKYAYDNWSIFEGMRWRDLRAEEEYD